MKAAATEAELRAHAPVAIPDPIWLTVREAYAVPRRYYHNLAHVGEVAQRYTEVRRDVGWERPAEVFCAVLFHDAIYVAGAKDNEAASARLAQESIERLWPGHDLDLDWIAHLIDLTASHGRLDGDSITEEEARFLDCDMAILGAPVAAFASYCDGVRREYTRAIPLAAYASGRRVFLTTLRAAPRIFLSGYFHDRLDAVARANLDRALDDSDADLRRGATLFDDGAYFEAHEVWEDRWRLTDDELDRHFYQGLIQCAAALLHLADEGGRQALLDRARGHFAELAASTHRSVDTDALLAAIESKFQDPTTLVCMAR